jgi:hypothetical protein
VNNPDFKLISAGCDFNHLHAGMYGGFIYGLNIGDVAISGCKVQNITSGLGGGFI